MKLYNIKTSPPTLMAEFNRQNNVVYMHPILRNAIEVQKGVVIPAINKLTAQFGGLCKIPLDHPKFSRAFRIYLEVDFLSHPEIYQWQNGDTAVIPTVRRIEGDARA